MSGFQSPPSFNPPRFNIPWRTVGDTLNVTANGLSFEHSSASATVYVIPSGDATGVTDYNNLVAAQNKVAALGGGFVFMASGTWILSTPLTLISGVSIIGVPTQKLPQAGNNFTGTDWMPVGGTIITPAPGCSQGFIYNSVDLASDAGPPPWMQPILSGVSYRDLCFSGFPQEGMAVGALHRSGAQLCEFVNLAFYRCGAIGNSYSLNSAAFRLQNFGSIFVDRIYGSGCRGGFVAYASTTSEQPGNSNWGQIVWDTGSVNGAGPPGSTASVANFVRPVVIGTDPRVATNTPSQNLITINYLQSQALQRNIQLDTLTISAGQVMSVTNAANFPVGMPIQSQSNWGNIKAYQTYFVLSSDTVSNVITIGNYRGAAAIVPTAGPVAFTIQQRGYPPIDLGGVQTNPGGLSEFYVSAVDCESSSASPMVYTENVVSSEINLSYVGYGSSPNQCSLCVRGQAIGGANGLTINSNSPSLNIDVDSTNLILNGAVGVRMGTSAYCGLGLVQDQTIGGAGGFSLGGTQFNAHGTNTPLPHIINIGGYSYIRPIMPIGTATASISAGGLLNNAGLESGYWSLEQATPQTYTLPQAANTSVVLSTVGMTYEFVNVGAGAATVEPNANVAGQYINDNNALVNNKVVLTTGQWAKFICSWNAITARTYWACMTNGTIS